MKKSCHIKHAFASYVTQMCAHICAFMFAFNCQNITHAHTVLLLSPTDVFFSPMFAMFLDPSSRSSSFTCVYG